MNNIVANFDQILDFGKKYGLPMSKKKGIVREYLQAKILDCLYLEKESAGLVFVGGTSLRLLYNLNRFSEDLDFDLDGIGVKEVEKMVEKVVDNFERENIAVDVYENKTNRRSYFEFRFLNLLYELDLGGHVEEKLTIKLDCEDNWQKQASQGKLMSRYGFVVRAVSVPLSQHLVQKMTAYLGRAQTQPRDIYDLVWLVAQGAKVDWKYAQDNKIGKDMVEKVKTKFENERENLGNYKARLRPFLIDEEQAEKIELLGELLSKTPIKGLDDYFYT